MILIIGAVRLFLIFFSIFSSEEKNSYNKKASPEVVILKEPVCDSVKHIIIGDSQTPFVDNASELVNRISNKSGVQTLWEGGRTLSWLVQALEGYKTDSCVVSVVFCIGTNGAYSNKDNIEKLISLTCKKFPNSKLYAVQGSWGWGGIKNVKEEKARNYYKKFGDLGVTIIEPPIGNIEPHGNKPIYKVIGKNIDSLIEVSNEQFR